jgi:hypothetical protein
MEGRDAVRALVSWLEQGNDLIGLAHLSASIRGDRGYPFGMESCWASD